MKNGLVFLEMLESFEAVIIRVVSLIFYVQHDFPSLILRLLQVA
jgi:hypothetical protein